MQQLEKISPEKLQPFLEGDKRKTKQLQEINDAFVMVENQILGERTNVSQDSKEIEKKLGDAKLELKNIEQQIKVPKNVKSIS